MAKSTSPLGRNLKAAREAAEPRKSQEALARAIGVSTRALIAWEQGEAHPRWENLVALGEELGLDPSWFYADHETEGLPA